MKANEKRRKIFASDYPDALYYAALCRERADDLQGALTAYREVIAENPNYQAAWKRIRELEQRAESPDDIHASCTEKSGYEEGPVYADTRTG